MVRSVDGPPAGHRKGRRIAIEPDTNRPRHYPIIWRLLLLLIAFGAGCTRIHQEEGWTFQGLETVRETQTICLESLPPADLWVDGEYAGQTPLEMAFPYGVHEIRLLKRRYKTTSTGQQTVLSSESATRSLLQESSHTLRFRAPGYHDRILPLTVPRFQETLRVRLRQKIGPGFPVTVRLTVNALKDQFPLIRSILGRYDIGGDHDDLREGNTEPAGPDSEKRSYHLTVADPAALSDLLSDLFLAAKERHFIFNVAEAGMSARLAANPVREFRAVWIAYLDWPAGEKGADGQKAALIRILDALERLRINAVFLQVRVEGDALYRTDLAPWSRLLTGDQGQDPGYDPLAFAVSAAHDRGIELHAWLNPYRTRLSRRCGRSGAKVHPRHVSRTHPEWLLEFRMSKTGGCCCYRMLNPGIPGVVDHIGDVVADIVRRYDVDGIHFDDMFYPYPEGPFSGAGGEDLAAFRLREDPAMDIETWRRENINRMIRTVNDRIKSVKPFVRFGVSPFGIWRNGVPEGVTGMGGRDAIYSDALAWLERGSIDYLTPQLYWQIGGRSDYRKLLEWWAEKGAAFERHIYPGQIIYYLQEDIRGGNGDKPRTSDEIVSQLDLNRSHRGKGVLGNVFYRTVNIEDCALGETALSDRLQKKHYATPALPPTMPWLPMIQPQPPENLEFIADHRKSDGITLSWDDPNPPASVWKYAVYAIHREDLADDASGGIGNLITVTGRRKLNIGAENLLDSGDRVYITAVSRNNVESGPSAGIVLNRRVRQ